MPDPKKKSIFKEEIILITIGIAIVYWIIDSIFWIFAGSDMGFSSTGMGNGLGEIGARIIVVCLFAIFGSHVHQMIKKQRIAQQDIENLKIANEKMAREIAELKMK
jgi:hypothetical protein